MKSKDESILKFLARINLVDRGWQIVDHWDADTCAIGVGRSDTGRLVYISTFKKGADLYDYECEVPSSDSDVPFETTSEAANVPFEEVLVVLSRHLDDKEVAGQHSDSSG